MYRGCLAFRRLLWFYIIRNSSRGRKEKRKNDKPGGIHGPGWLWLGGKRSREYLPVFATSNTQSTRHVARSGPKTHAYLIVYTRVHCVPRRRERKKVGSRAEKQRGCRRATKRARYVHTYLVHIKPYTPAGAWCARVGLVRLDTLRFRRQPLYQSSSVFAVIFSRTVHGFRCSLAARW